MTRFLIGAVLAFLSTWTAALADGGACGRAVCAGDAYLLYSASSARAYGVVVTLPVDAPCAVARVVVMDGENRRLGESDLLVPGQQGRVRLGAGFAAGVHLVRLRVSGCDAQATGVRRITLHKASPDHGWRAAAGLSS